ncbi:histidinol dehydrogenase [Humidisolicoccus flavus]|uniref:histidinol dehydrogenase n=1 Tax=Humidisolicoccus flavus TaxID=3111414 RepID=UPI0032515A65
MIQRIDLRAQDIQGFTLPRASVEVADALDAATALISAVREHGGDALYSQAEQFDGIRPPSLRVSAEELSAALAALAPEVRAALEVAIARVRTASAAAVPPPITTEIAPGATVEQRWQPVERVGLYVPGGKAVYPSSVVMNVVAAQAAGVQSIVVATPAQSHEHGRPNSTVLAACALLGVTEVLVAGGAGAIGALAYGVPGLVAPVDAVTGPGNVFVAAAKRAVAGKVGIDAEAGPTEILIIADASANPTTVAADLVSQAEHDELASAILVTDSGALIESVARELEELSARTHHAERVGISLAGEQSALVLVDSLEDAAVISNRYAPEHLEIITQDPEAILRRITSAGAIFLGENSPVSLGDYAAGSNHVLPTGGVARFGSGLSAATFLRPQQVVRYSNAALREVQATIRTLSNAENLPAHGDAVDARFTKDEN